MRVMASFVLVLVAGAGCGNRDDGRGGANGCTPGEQVSCSCVAGGNGVQICNADGVSFGQCMGCDSDEGTGAPSSSSGDPATSSATQTTGAATTTSDQTDEGPITSSSETAASLFEWVWVDHGGPAFLPHACTATAGVVDGMLVDPQAFFESLVAGRDPNDWVAVMNEIEPSLWACGVGQQRSSGGDVRGRLFLPNDSCPDAAPPADDPKAMFLGVRQDPPCWDHPVDVIAEN